MKKLNQTRHDVHKEQSGFTLIELIIVIALISILSGTLIVKIGGSTAAARDARRKSDMRKLQTVLLTYYVRNSSYPVSDAGGTAYFTSEPGDEGLNNNNGNWIPGLAPTLVAALPRDPKGGPGNTALAAGCGAASRKSAFRYRSDGVNFKIVANCSPESTPLNAGDTFNDPSPARVAAGTAWMVCSGDPACSTW